MLAYVYKSLKKADTYLYLAKRDDFAGLPEPLRTQLGSLQFVLEVELTPERRLARDLIGEGGFMEVFVDAPLAVCEGRDVKGLYAKARRGELRNFTGIDSPYEAPETPELHLMASESSPVELAEQVIRALAAD